MMTLQKFPISGFFNPDIRKYPDIDNIAHRLAYDGVIRPKSCKYSANDATRYPMKFGCPVTHDRRVMDISLDCTRKMTAKIGVFI